MRISHGGLLIAAAIGCWTAWTLPVRADWQSCLSKPTRSCLLDEAFRGPSGPIAGKDRLDVIALTDIGHHPEYLTPADIDEAIRQITSEPGARAGVSLYYFSVAATGLVAGNRIEEAYDLISRLDPGARSGAINYMTTALIKADKLDEVPIFGRRMLADARSVFQEAAKVSADNGKIEQALAFITLSPLSLSTEEMLMVIGIAYAKRGDTKMATRFYDRAQSALNDSRPGAAVMADRDMTLRFEQISLQALRGDMEGVKSGLKELPPVSDNPSNWVEMNRVTGYNKLVALLLRFDRDTEALDIARGMPERIRIYYLAAVAGWDVEHKRLDDARAVWHLVEDKADPKMRGSFFRRLAVATAQAGDVKSAIALASQTSDPVWHRAILFEVAQTLPP